MSATSAMGRFTVHDSRVVPFRAVRSWLDIFSAVSLSSGCGVRIENKLSLSLNELPISSVYLLSRPPYQLFPMFCDK